MEPDHLQEAIAAGTPEWVKLRLGADGGTKNCPNCRTIFVCPKITDGYYDTAFDVGKAVSRLNQAPLDEPVKVFLRGEPNHDLLITGSIGGEKFCIFINTSP